MNRINGSSELSKCAQYEMCQSARGPVPAGIEIQTLLNTMPLKSDYYVFTGCFDTANVGN